jgi:beta-lactamase regulating signal transducer with metallopeptidase domain
MEHYAQNLFLRVLNMNVTASYVILFVVIARLFLKKAPKIFSYSLWSVVMFRLICTLSFSCAFSFLNPIVTTYGKMEHIPLKVGIMAQPKVDVGIKVVNTVINKSLPSATPIASSNPMEIILFVLSIIWTLGMLALVTYGIVSYMMLKKKVSTAMLIYDNIFECEKIKTPFVLGIMKPKIYLPIGLGEKEKSYILKHEQTHIKGFDYIIKPIAFLMLCVHWFNPLVWLSFILMSNDMEMACDEKVIKELGSGIKKDYSTSLLSMSVGKKLVNGSPLAFGENNTKRRIKNVLKYKKPAFWILIVGVVISVVIGIGLVSNPINKKAETSGILSEKEKLQKVSKGGVSNSNNASATSTKEASLLVENNLKIILSSPLTSSNPNDYIEAHRTEYENILKDGGEDALNYMLLQFKKGNVKNDLSGQVIMRLCEDQLGQRNNVEDENLLPTEWYSKLRIKKETILPDFSYKGTDPIEKLVYETEMEKNQNIRNDRSFLIVTPYIHASYEEGNKLKVFVTTYACVYQLFDKRINPQTSGIIPAAITYVKNADGNYKLDKYEQAEDGNSYTSSIKAFCTMPVSGKRINGLSDKIFKYEGNNEEIIKIEENLVEHLKANGQTGISIRKEGKIIQLT